MSRKPSNHVFFVYTNPLYEVVRMTMSNSVRGLKTSLEVFPAPLRHLHTHDKLRMDFLTYYVPY